MRGMSNSPTQITPETRPSATRAGALLGFGQRLGFVLRLRVADGLRQHLLKFGLGLCLLARPRFPRRHENNMGMRAVKLKHPRKRWGRFRKVVS